MADKLAVYICSGCGIGEALDCAQLAKTVKPAAKVHPFLCGPEGLAQIRADGAERIVIAGCSPRVKTDAFAFEHERVNLREHVAWSHAAGDEETQALAVDYLAMGLAKVQKVTAVQPLADPVSKRLLVVGAGVAGSAAAVEAAEAGYEVVLVDAATKAGPGHARVDFRPAARIAKTEGQPGAFDVTLESGETLRVGAIVQATGWKPYDASKLPHLGYGISPDVVTNVDIERMAANGGVKRPSDGQPPRDVLFVQCAGSRDPEHLPYCSTVCCTATLRHAAAIRKQNPEARVYVIYKDVRTPGHNEKLYQDAQNDALVFLTKGEVEGVAKLEDGRLRVTARNTLVGENVAVDVDMVVLATGMVPNADDALHLGYRQGPDLPVLEAEFPDSHFVCFPYETRRTGIYAAGAARAPMDDVHAREDGAGAAMKAIQCVEMAARGEAVHPRAGDNTYPNFFLQRCTQCKRCTEECPFGSLDEDVKGTPKPNPYRCRRCGICMGACPERIVSFQNYSVDIVASMIKAIEVPEEDEEKPRVLALMCENDAYPALDAVGARRIEYDPSVRVVPVRCLGSVNVVWIADALSRGFDGVLLVGCKYGDDYQCHFVKGSELAAKRMENVKETLQRLQLEQERLELRQLSIDECEQLPGIINGFMERIGEMGPNPYKGF